MKDRSSLYQEVLRRIEEYKPQGGLDTSSKLFLHMVSVKHGEVRDHCAGVALLAEAVAIREKKDGKAAFFGGLFHDVGKAILPAQLFDGHNITAEEYATIKEHACFGFEILKDMHLFTAVCSGAHHAMYKAGYGITVDDLPKEWGLESVAKVLEIATIISICDFIDAFTHRKTQIRDGSDAAGPSLSAMLKAKYPNHGSTVEIAIEANIKLNS